MKNLKVAFTPSGFSLTETYTHPIMPHTWRYNVDVCRVFDLDAPKHQATHPEPGDVLQMDGNTFVVVSMDSHDREYVLRHKKNATTDEIAEYDAVFSQNMKSKLAQQAEEARYRAECKFTGATYNG